MAVFVSPGSSSQFFQRCEIEEDDESMQREEIPFIYQESESGKPLNKQTLTYCDKCQLPKPQRAHHCSICNQCVLKMDHHCPWINGCVGHANHRYFLLFLLYVWLGVTYVAICSVPVLIWNMGVSPLFRVLCPLNFVLALALGVFTGWNWFLAIKGHTAIEFWGIRLPNSQGIRFDFSRGNLRANLRETFGEFSYIWQIMLPSTSSMVSNGVIWETETEEELAFL